MTKAGLRAEPAGVSGCRDCSTPQAVTLARWLLSSRGGSGTVRPRSGWARSGGEARRRGRATPASPGHCGRLGSIGVAFACSPKEQRGSAPGISSPKVALARLGAAGEKFRELVEAEETHGKANLFFSSYGVHRDK